MERWIKFSPFTQLTKTSLALLVGLGLSSCKGQFQISDLPEENPAPLAPGSPTLTVNDVTANENAGTLTFTVGLSVASTKDVSVDYAAAAGSATGGGIDYALASGTMNIPAGSTSGSIVVTINDDALDEVDETFTVNLANAVEAVITDAIGVGTITDNDATPTLSINDISALENAGTLTFTITLSAISGKDVNVNYTASGGTATGVGVDYALVAGVATIPAGSSVTTVVVNLVDDSLDESNETFNLALSSPVNATLSDGTGVGTITDDDATPTVTFAADQTLSEPSNGGGPVSVAIDVTLSAASGLSVTVPFAVSGTATGGGVDHNLANGSITVSAGQTTGSVSFDMIDDLVSEASETVIATMGSPTNASQGAKTTHTVTITDNDATPTLSINDVTADEADGTLSFTVTLSAVSAQNVTVDYSAAGGTATSGGTDYTLAPGTATITAGSTTTAIVVNINNDTLDESDETFVVTLANPNNATLSDATGTGTITDNDATPTLSINDVTADEADGTISFTVTLSAASGQNVTVNYSAGGGTATSGGTDYTLAAGTATITAGSTSTSIVATLNNDTLDESDETFTVTLASPTNATISDATGTGTITDNDATPSVTFAADQNITEPANSMGPSAVNVNVTLSAASGLTVTVPYTVSGTATGGGTDHNLADGNITVTAGSTTGTATFDLTDDALQESSEQ